MKVIRVAFIGAGGANFGSVEGPWNHAKRLVERPEVKVVGIADPAPGLAARRAREWSRHPQFGGTAVFTDWRRMLKAVRPAAAIIAVPPAAHGGGKRENNIERVCAASRTAMLIEKPLSCRPPAEVERSVAAVRRSGVIVSVGYMLRYLKMVDFARRLMKRYGVRPRHVILRYATAYSEIRKRDWWDAASSGGPIVEQATHFVDLARYIAGEADAGTLKASAIGSRAALSDMPATREGRSVEAGIPAPRRVPRTVSASWVAGGDCLCTLVHGVILHRIRYETDIDIWADGFHMHMHDPYGGMRVRLRRPRSDSYETFSFRGDDPYRTEMRSFLKAVASGDRGPIRSSYDDAFRTYSLTWEIARRAARSTVQPAR